MRSLPPTYGTKHKWASSIQKNTKTYFKVFHKIPFDINTKICFYEVFDEFVLQRYTLYTNKGGVLI